LRCSLLSLHFNIGVIEKSLVSWMLSLQVIISFQFRSKVPQFCWLTVSLSIYTFLSFPQFGSLCENEYSFVCAWTCCLVVEEIWTSQYYSETHSLCSCSGFVSVQWKQSKVSFLFFISFVSYWVFVVCLFVNSGRFGVTISFGESVVLYQSCLQLGKKISFYMDSELEVCSWRDLCFMEFCCDSFGIDNFILGSLSKIALVKVCNIWFVNWEIHSNFYDIVNVVHYCGVEVRLSRFFYSKFFMFRHNNTNNLKVIVSFSLLIVFQIILQFSEINFQMKKLFSLKSVLI
jgi:hypothetical protein